MMSDGEEEGGGGGRSHFSFPAIVRSEKDAGKKRKKPKKGKEEEEHVHVDDFKVDVSDPRFKAIFESHLYAPDPSHPQYRWAWHGCSCRSEGECFWWGRPHPRYEYLLNRDHSLS